MKLLGSFVGISGAQNLLLNGDFSGSTAWNTHGSTELVIDQENGISFARVNSRSENWHGLYQDITIGLQPDTDIYVASFSTKIVSAIDVETEWDPWTFGFGARASIKLEREVDNETVIEWINCGNVCTGKCHL